MMLYQFKKKESLKKALENLQGKSFKTFSPLPEKDLMESGNQKSKIPVITFLSGLIGMGTGLIIQVYPNLWSYPQNIGGRPLFSWPAFIIVIFELIILFAGLGILFGFIWENRFPRFDEEVFDNEEFRKAFGEDYFILTEEKDLADVADKVYNLSADDSEL